MTAERIERIAESIFRRNVVEAADVSAKQQADRIVHEVDCIFGKDEERELALEVLLELSLRRMHELQLQAAAE